MHFIQIQSPTIELFERKLRPDEEIRNLKMAAIRNVISSRIEQYNPWNGLDPGNFPIMYASIQGSI